MQGSNYRETAGIVIGPEFSRIFSEIIFQEIDRRISLAVAAHNLNVSIRRYIDDFFVFAGDRKSAEAVYEVVGARLAEKAMSDLSQQNVSGVETMNLLIALKSLDGSSRISEDLLLKSHSAAKNQSGLVVRRNYFEIMSLLYYAGTNPAYKNLIAAVMSDIESIVSDVESADRDAEATLLIFDLISCPSLDKAFKGKMVDIAIRRILGGIPSNAEINAVLNYASAHLSFIDWDAGPNLERLLQKKELTLAY